MNNENKIIFSKFRKEKLKSYECPDILKAKNWEEQRAIAQRVAFIEHDIKDRWNKLNG